MPVPVASRPISGASLLASFEYQESCLEACLNGVVRGTWPVLAVMFTSLAVPLLPSLLPGKDLRFGPCSEAAAFGALSDMPELGFMAKHTDKLQLLQAPLTAFEVHITPASQFLQHSPCVDLLNRRVRDLPGKAATNSPVPVGDLSLLRQVTIIVLAVNLQP